MMSFEAARLIYQQTWLSTTAGAAGWCENSRERLKFHSALKNLRCRFFDSALWIMQSGARWYQALSGRDCISWIMTCWSRSISVDMAVMVPPRKPLSLREWFSTFIPLYFLVQSQCLLARHSPFDLRHKFSPYNSSFASLALSALVTSVKIITMATTTKEENGPKDGKKLKGVYLRRSSCALVLASVCSLSLSQDRRCN